MMPRWTGTPLLILLSLVACTYPGTRVGERLSPPRVLSSEHAPATAASEPAAFQPIPLGAGYGARRGSIEVYFTNPESPLAAQLTGGLDGPLIDALDAARLRIDMAAYRLDSYPIRAAILRAQGRGVRVRLVMEADDLDSWDAIALIEAGVPIVADWPDGLMHDKFVVIDGAEVWTGSMNFTSSGIYRDHNNLVRLVSRDLAELYTGEFEEMSRDRHFGPLSPASTASPAVTVDDVLVHAYFAPEDAVSEQLARLIRSAEQSIHFLAFSFTSDELGEAIRERARRGVEVQGVMDADQVRSNQGTEYDAFRGAGLSIRTDTYSGQMHSKVLIIDESVVVTGSYNFSGSAERRNDENVLVVEDPLLAAQFLAEFWRVFESAQP